MVILGIGNDMRGDDGLGPEIILRLSETLMDDDITLINGGNVPENFTGSIKEVKPSHIILIDAVDFKKKPGYIKLVKKEKISNYNISTHAMPISFLINYLEHSTNANIVLIGIQPKNMDLNSKMSIEVEESLLYLTDLLERLLKKSMKKEE
ncbi:MAG: hydrogenase maturation peptidase HycI [Methanobacteriaceae archaeon]|nr:hydrogenase maturation peptidase HycI [Methanobacteriaceae archaeon]